MVGIALNGEDSELERSRLAAIVNSSNDAIASKTLDGIITTWNGAAERLFGYTAREVIGSPMTIIFPADRLDEERMLLARIAQGESVYHYETVRVRKDGSAVEVSVTLSPIFDRKGRIVGASKIARDISDRRLAEAARRQELERLVAERTAALTGELTLRKQAEASLKLVTAETLAVFEHAAIGIATAQAVANGRFLRVNDGLCKMLGYAREELLGLTFNDITHPDDLPANVEKVRAILTGEVATYRMEKRYLHRDGHAVWADVAMALMRDQDGGPTYFIAALVGITDRKRAEAALQRTEGRLRLALANSPVSVWEQDLDLRYTWFFNPRLGYTVESVIGKTDAELMDSACAAELETVKRRVIETGQAARQEVTAPGAPLEYYDLSIEPLRDNAGRIIGITCAGADVSERKALELDLKRSNAELEQFAYVASHDLRQPLRAVSSYLGLIEKSLNPDLLSDDIKEFIGYAVKGSKRMDRLILDLLEYSRTGRTARSEAVPLAEAIAVAVGNLTVAISDSDGQVVVADNLPVVHGDPMELTRLFQNLIGNALKYRAPERAPRVEISCCRNEREWLVAIGDNGIGIAPKDQDRAFAIFQRLVPQDAYEGTGIGLALCKKIVEHHGGRIWIESEVGKGSTFFFTLRYGAAAT